MSTATWQLRPGVHVVPRDDEHVQLGLDPPGRVLVRRDPVLLAVLDDLVRGRHPGTATGTAATVALLDELRRAGLLVRAARRVEGSVSVVDLGLGLASLATPRRGRGRRAATPDGEITVVGSVGPVPRRVLDDLVASGRPHLVLAGTGQPGSLRLGPLVEPGTTACQRCVDAEEALSDPRRTLVLDQLAALAPAPLDESLVALGTTWAQREVAAYLRGERPVTWSGSVDLHTTRPEARTWQRHPHCGCAWDLLAW